MQYQSVDLAPRRNGTAEGKQRPTHRGATAVRPGTDLVDGEHVEVRDVVLVGVLDPRPALLLVDQLSDVLVHKLALFEKADRRRVEVRNVPGAAATVPVSSKTPFRIRQK